MRRTIPLALLLVTGACQQAPLALDAAGEPARDATLAGSGYSREVDPDTEDDGGGGTLGSGTLRDGGYLGSGNVTGGEDGAGSPGLGSGGG